MPKTIAGIVDRLTQNSVVGWARNPDTPGVQVAVDFFLNNADEPFFSVTANRRHGGLAAVGIEDIHGFSCQWPQPLQVRDQVLAAVPAANRRLFNTPLQVGVIQNDPCLYSQRYNYLVYYNFKSACTFVRLMFVNLHRAESGLPATELQVDAARTAFKPPDEFSERALADLKSVVVVRNPYQRVVSMFMDKVVSWCYEPELCYGEEIFEHFFQSQQENYARLTFMQFLEYLRDNVLWANMHFRKQPLITDTTAVWRAESLEQDVLSFYRQCYPALQESVAALFNDYRDNQLNQSLNSRQTTWSLLANAPQLPIVDLSHHLSRYGGIRPESFFTGETLPLIEAIYGAESEYYGYVAPQPGAT